MWTLLCVVPVKDVHVNWKPYHGPECMDSGNSVRDTWWYTYASLEQAVAAEHQFLALNKDADVPPRTLVLPGDYSSA